MKTITLAETPLAAVAREAAGALARGSVVLFPTDTLYGLGADAFSDEAVDRVYEIKGRDTGKPMHCIVADMDMAAQYAVVDDLARMLAKELLPGALTLVLPKRAGVEGGIARGMETIGVRIPDSPLCLEIARTLARPYTATSANKAGEPTLPSVGAIVEQLGEGAELIALAIDAGALPERLASTVVDLSGSRPVILREGAIPAADIWDALRTEY